MQLMNKLVLLRHGQSQWNLENKFTGWKDVPLTEKGVNEANNQSLLDFRQNYLNELQSVSNGNLIVIDKMPQNFRYIGLLAAAFPEAKIVHVKRNPAAVCWANYKQYFVSNDIGYCYAIDDLVSYHKLYENLMGFWRNTLSNRITTLITNY